MSQPRHRPQRRFPKAQRRIIECELETCPHCEQSLHPRKPWHMRKTVQTLTGPLFVAVRGVMGRGILRLGDETEAGMGE